MAWIEQNSPFDPDSLDQPVVGIASFLAQHDSGIHHHKRGQLLFSHTGCMRITVQKNLFIVLPRRAIWIPPNVSHKVEIREHVGYRSLYFDREVVSYMPVHPEIMEVNSLFRALLERMANSPFETHWDSTPWSHILTVCLHEMQTASRKLFSLPLPSDPRLAHTLSFNALPPPLHVLTRHVGASRKTIGRIFQKEIGLSYQQWRQQWRFSCAIERLAKKERISHIARHLEFDSDSAFIAFFRKMSGTTPRAYSAHFYEENSDL